MTVPKLLHVLGGGPWQVPTVRLAKSLGLRVLVTDMYQDRPAYALADAHEVVDITDREATLDAARRHGVDGIVCDTTDFGVVTAAYVAEQLGLPGIGYETSLNCTNKARMRRCVEHAGLAVPRHAAVDSREALADAVARVGLSLVVKPVDNQSGRGVSIVAREEDVAGAYDHARNHSRSGAVLLESVVAGTEIIVDGFVVDRRCHVLGIARKSPYDDNPTVASRILYESSWTLDCAEDRLREAVAATVEALGLRCGVFHAEFIVTADRIVVIDFAARGGGVMIYTHVIPHVANVDANRAMVEMSIGRPVSIRPAERQSAADIEFLRSGRGVLAAIEGVDQALGVPGIAAIHLNLRPGQRTGTLTEKDDRLGYIVALGRTTEDVIRAAERARSRLKVRLAGADVPQPVH
jgi:biotin carboxylase